MSHADRRIPCFGCGALVPNEPGRAHPYIGASMGCWRIYGDVLAREYGELDNPPYHRLTVDAYAAQHPGEECRRARQSVAGHLISLCLVLEYGVDPRPATRMLRSIVDGSGEFVWLDPPSFEGAPTVLDVARADGADDHERAVYRWARGVWSAWSPHHEAVREWAETLLVDEA